MNLEMDPRTQHLLTAPPLPLLARMSTPSTLAFLVQGMVSLAEVWFIGPLGSISLAAIALVFPLLMRVAVAGCISLSLGFIFDVGLVGIYYSSALGMISYAIIIAGALKFGAWRPSAK